MQTNTKRLKHNGKSPSIVCSLSLEQFQVPLSHSCTVPGEHLTVWGTSSRLSAQSWAATVLVNSFFNIPVFHLWWVTIIDLHKGWISLREATVIHFIYMVGIWTFIKVLEYGWISNDVIAEMHKSLVSVLGVQLKSISFSPKSLSQSQKSHVFRAGPELRASFTGGGAELHLKILNLYATSLTFRTQPSCASVGLRNIAMKMWREGMCTGREDAELTRAGHACFFIWFWFDFVLQDLGV